MRESPIFISHSASDKRFAKQLFNFLRAAGHEPWLDTWSIRLGQDIVQEVETGIGDSDFLLVVLTQASVQSEWVEREWRAKYWNNTTNQSRRILPIKMEECQVPGLLQSLRSADFTDDLLGGLTLLMESINKLTMDFCQDNTMFLVTTTQ